MYGVNHIFYSHHNALILQQEQSEEAHAVAEDSSGVNGNVQYVLQVFEKYFLSLSHLICLII